MKKNLIIGSISIIGIGLAFSVLAVPPFSSRLDFVNIGSPASEAEHNLQGWGPIEPAANGGNWGQIATETSCDLGSGDTCDRALRVTYAGAEPDHPLLNGRIASLTLKPANKWGLIRGLKIRALDGIANDDFLVFIKNKKGNWEQVYSYVSDPSASEVWKVHAISLYPKLWFKKSVEIAIMATGDTWNQHATYGQLGIDWIELVSKGFPGPTIDINDED